MTDDAKTNSLDRLRTALFEALDGVKSGTLDLERARQINELGKSLIDSARVEVEYLKASGGGESTFLDTTVGEGNLPPGITGIRQHRLKG